jgi:hypothetical protein
MVNAAAVNLVLPTMPVPLPVKTNSMVAAAAGAAANPQSSTERASRARCFMVPGDHSAGCPL